MFGLTKSQKLIYDMEKYAGGSIATICGSIIIKGKKEITDLIYAANELYRINDALRIRIIETDEKPFQKVFDYNWKKIDVLYFRNKMDLDLYAEKYAQEPMDFYDLLCYIHVIILDDAFGILVKLHHIISDAWTLALIGSQFSGILNGKSYDSYSYLQYISSEKKYLESKRYQKDKDFYIEQYRQCDELIYLSDKQVRTYIANRKTYSIDSTKVERIMKYVKESNTSLFMLLMTVLGVYINRIKMNCEKFYVGTAILNRSGLQERNTMGMFVNTVPVLFELDNDSTFKENLEKISNNIKTALYHHKFSYSDILSAIRNDSNFYGNLYDVMLSYQNAKIAGIEDEFVSTWYHCGMQIESLQIHIDDRDSEGILKVHYDYQTEKFAEKTIEKMHEHIFNLLFDAIDKDKKITKINILSEKEESILLNDFNYTKTSSSGNKCVHQLFEEQVLKAPDKIAIIACDRTLTYDELNRFSNRIANALIKKGIGIGDIVAFALPRTSYLIGVIFGILKSGGVYMPLDIDYPEDRTNYILADSNSKLFITERNINQYLSDNDESPRIELSNKSYCYCIYTSGSTGRPKGTILYHNGIVNLVKELNIYGDISKIHNIGLMTAITFDVATQEILTTLLNGFTGVLLPERRETEIEKIIDCIEKNKIDLIYVTPTYFDVLTSEYNNAEKLLRTLKTVVLAGEKFYLNTNTVELGKRYHTIFENQYGPAETHVIVTTATIQCENLRSEFR